MITRSMHGGVSLRLAILATTLVCGAFLAAPSSRAADAKAETWVVAGKTFERVRVLEVTAGTVMIAHAGGMVQLDLGKLPPELQARFGYDPEKAAAWRRSAESDMAATEDLKARQAAEQKRRAQLETMKRNIAQRQAEADPNYVEFRPEVDLRPVFIEHSLYLKNQGARPSCSIFAVVSVLEYEYARRFGSTDQLSEEYLIWAFQRAFPGKPINDGYNFGQVIDVLRNAGIARRAALPDSFAAHPKEADPPPAAVEDAATRREFSIAGFPPGDELLLARIVAALNTQTPVILGIKWPHHATLERNNLLRDQAPVAGAAHAVTLVGYTSDGTPESLVFIYRNSYGPQWGLGGYGLMAGSYLQKNVVTAFCLMVPRPE